MTPRQKRISLIVGGLATLSFATAPVANALNSRIAFFYTPAPVVPCPQDIFHPTNHRQDTAT